MNIQRMVLIEMKYLVQVKHAFSLSNAVTWKPNRCIQQAI